MSGWYVIPSPTDAEMSVVQGAYLVADNLPIEDATLIAAAPDLLEALDALVLDLDNNKGRRISLEAARVAIAKAKGEK